VTAENNSNGVAPTLNLRSALAIASTPVHAEWLHPPYVERGAMILMVGAEGTYKSFLALHWAMTIATAGELVIYLSAEGRGLWKRLRAWATHHYPRQHWRDTLNGLPLLALERPLNLSELDTVVMLTGAIDAVTDTRGRPALIVVDTITRNSNGALERSNEDALMYLNGLDQCIRARYGSSVILIHHIGHAARDRARGPFALIGNTDANFLLERPDLTRPVVTVRSGRMKDCQPPPPFELEAHVVTLDEVDEDGKPVTSLALKGTGRAPVTLKRPSGKNQKTLLHELERLAGQPGEISVWTEGQLREVARKLGMGRQSATDAVHGLRELRYFVPTIGGSRLAHIPEKGQKRQNVSESQDSDEGSSVRESRESFRTLLSDVPPDDIPGPTAEGER
jgi:hypothetical protein